jgi:hypothetical protein
MTSIKVPKEVMEVFYEGAAAGALAAAHDSGWFPSLKAIYYAQKATKARAFAWRALGAVHPQTLSGVWTLDIQSGVATKQEPEAPVKPKKTRAKKAVPATPVTTTTEGVK